MSDFKDNIHIEYCYRDSGNYKTWGEFVITNSLGLSFEHIQSILVSSYEYDTNFYTEKWGVKSLNEDHYNPTIDPTWHEVTSITIANESHDGLDRYDIKDIISNIENNKSHIIL